MKIKFAPYFHMQEATHVLSGLVWSYGEIKDVDPAWTIRVRVDGQPISVNVVDDLLSSDEYQAVDEEQPAAAQDEIPSAQSDN